MEFRFGNKNARAAFAGDVNEVVDTSFKCGLDRRNKEWSEFKVEI
jgi:hypothetical protein